MAVEVADSLMDHDRPIEHERNVWLVFAWDHRRGGEPVGQAAYGWIDGAVVREAMTFDPEFAGINLEGFLDYMGSALFGGRPVTRLRDSGDRAG